MRFTGKCAVVTGAATGIGKAVAQQIAANGGNLVLLDMDSDGLEKLKAELAAFPVRVLTFVCDISDEYKVKTFLAEAKRTFEHIDILINNAGIWRRSMPFAETTSDMWRRYIDVNIIGTLNMTHALLPGMLENGWGRIVNVGSVAGVYGNANMADYSMTKGAIIAFTKALAKEVTAQGVLVNCVSPGSVSNVQDEPEPSSLSFTGRTGTHTENANLICFLASEEASYISGQNYQVDGCRKKM